jgi:prophage regulatory protein
MNYDNFTTGERLLPPTAVMARTSLSRPTLWRMVRRGDFPPSVSISPGRVAWPETAINDWIAARLTRGEDGR